MGLEEGVSGPKPKSLKKDFSEKSKKSPKSQKSEMVFGDLSDLLRDFFSDFWGPVFGDFLETLWLLAPIQFSKSFWPLEVIS